MCLLKQASQRAWHSLSKMNLAEKIELRKSQRRENRTKVRQAVLVNEYIYCKYFAVYQEAAQYYNELNCLHPTKYDLRKCDEFKAWKMATMGYPIRTTRKRSKPCHTAIPVTDVNSFTIVSEQSTSTEQTANSNQSTSPEQHPEQSVQAASPEQMVNPSVNQKVMQLRIPLLKPSVVTETLHIVTEETIQENPLQVAVEEIAQESTTLHPSLQEEIPQDVIERIMSELREDPELRSIMTDIEQDLEFKQIGMEIDIQEDDQLENELNWEIW